VIASSEAEIRSRGARLSIETGPRSRGRPTPSEAESHSKGCPTLERGGTSPEGATSPRARRSFYQCDTATLERSGVLPEGGQAACLVGHGPTSLSYACC
jgi:hypothetical protein